MSSQNKFIGSGIILTLDLFVISFGNWIFWILISMLASTAEIGVATAVYSFVLLFSSITMLGLEYTIIKKSSIDKTFVFGTTILLKILILVISLPIFIVLLNQLGFSLASEIAYIAIGIFAFSSFRYIFRYILLGNFESIRILLINIIGMVSQLLIGFYLVLNNFGSVGILVSFLVNVMVITVLSILLLKRNLNLQIGNRFYFLDLVKDALINFPPVLTRSMIFYFSVVLLAFLGISESNIGIFYIAMMMSIIAGGLAGNMALTLIPSSLVSNKNLSFDGLRISLSLTSPIIALLLTEPQRILGLIGSHYVDGTGVLVIFSLGIIPYVIITNSVTNFNTLNQPRKIVVVGLVQFGSFLISFFTLVPLYGITGGALSVFISMLFSSLLSIRWYGSSISKNILIACFSIFVALLLNYGLTSFTILPLIISTITTLLVTLAMNVVMKNISIGELKDIFMTVKQMTRKKEGS